MLPKMRRWENVDGHVMSILRQPYESSQSDQAILFEEHLIDFGHSERFLDSLNNTGRNFSCMEHRQNLVARYFRK